MAKKINNFDMTRMRVEECFGFLKKIESETVLLTLETDKEMVATFEAAVTAFDEALKASRKNSKTADVEAADAKVDKAWRTLTQLTKVLTQHPTEEIQDAATEAYSIVQKYGDITDMAYNEEYGNLHNAMQELTAISTEKQKLILIDTIIAVLSSGYSAFMIASAQWSAEESQRQVGIVKETRTAAEDAYRTMVERVNALVVVNGEANYATFIDNVNVIIASAKTTLSARKTRSAAKQKPPIKRTDTEEASTSTPTFTDEEESASSGR